MVNKNDRTNLEEMARFFLAVNNLNYESTLRRVLYQLYPDDYAWMGTHSSEDEVDEIIETLDDALKWIKKDQCTTEYKEHNYQTKSKLLLIGLGAAGANFIFRSASCSLVSENMKLIITDNHTIMDRAQNYDSLFVGAGKERAKCPEDIVAVFNDELHMIRAAFRGYDCDKAIVIFGAGGNMCWGLQTIETICDEMGISTIVPSFFLPFSFEAKDRIDNSKKITEIIKGSYQKYVVLDNNQAFSICDKHSTIDHVCSILDQMLIFNLQQII